MPQEILYDVDDRVATVTLNAPERLNAISRTMHARNRRGAGGGRARPGTYTSR